ncbi:MAG: YifB family Mg chelatase-like AAA ATPase [Burkholderiales bacterium]|nr:YifB family Mg chelatase-like AAA ATPase [Burkholderiales bacterium]
MGFARLYTRSTKGMLAPEVIVEVHVANGLPSFAIVGLPDTEVKESRDRVRSAIQMSGFEFPARRITVNLAPADLPKDSSRFDLPIALGVLLASGLIKPHLEMGNFEFAGELALDGGLRAIKGALAIAYNARESSRGFILPQSNADEASLVDGVTVYAAGSLSQVVLHITGENLILPVMDAGIRACNPKTTINELNLNQVRGQMSAKTALEIAASGRHSLLMVGNPGCGKSMLAQRIVTILPLLNDREAITTASIYSVSNSGFNLDLWGKAPFRQPHHSSSSAAIVGGGHYPMPGEISLAHNGVLFLDEIAEFERSVIEVLREPLETKQISLSRARYKVEFPADFQLIAAMNPCPCGNRGHPQKVCVCSPSQVSRYCTKLSAPFLDRIDLVVEVPYLKADELAYLPMGEDSAVVRKRVFEVRDIQLQRQNKLNYALNNQEILEYAVLTESARTLLTQLSEKMALSARAYYKILKVARTIADLGQQKAIETVHIAQSMQYSQRNFS